MPAALVTAAGNVGTVCAEHLKDSIIGRLGADNNVDADAGAG